MHRNFYSISCFRDKLVFLSVNIRVNPCPYFISRTQIFSDLHRFYLLIFIIFYQCKSAFICVLNYAFWLSSFLASQPSSYVLIKKAPGLIG
jgi:hypothetical protein